jgi:outer membrane protein TolC
MMPGIGTVARRSILLVLIYLLEDRAALAQVPDYRAPRWAQRLPVAESFQAQSAVPAYSAPTHRYEAQTEAAPPAYLGSPHSSPEMLPSGTVAAGCPIDLPTALRLADASNTQVAFAREQIREALARAERAGVLWLPSLRGGASFNRHEEAIQDVSGVQFPASRGAFYAGAGAGGFGAGSPMVPGVYANFRLADAIFQPLAARQFAAARQHAAAATTNDVLLRVALAYLELLRASEDLVIAQQTRQQAEDLANLTAAFARTGQGLMADANRAATDLAIRVNEVYRAEEAVRVASARLAQLLRLDPTAPLVPIEPVVAPIHLVPNDCPLSEFVAQSLTNRPEVAQNRFLVGDAVQRLRQQRYGPLLPSILLGVSYGGMSAGPETQYAPFEERLDLDVLAYWELRQLGFGERAAAGEARSQLRQAEIRQVETMDIVAREVVEAHAQVQARSQQIGTAESAIQVARESYRQNSERIQGGEGLPIEVLQSIQALAQAQREYLRAVIDYNAAQFSLQRALGWPVTATPQHP